MANRKRVRKIFTAAYRRKNEASNQTALHGGLLKSIITILAGRKPGKVYQGRPSRSQN